MNRSAVLQSLEALRSQLEHHERLLKGELPGSEPPAATCGQRGCCHQKRLCRVLLDVATVLDGTRKAFKSPQIEALRKECLRIVAEEMGTDGRTREPNPSTAGPADDRVTNTVS